MGGKLSWRAWPGSRFSPSSARKPASSWRRMVRVVPCCSRRSRARPLHRSNSLAPSSRPKSRLSAGSRRVASGRNEGRAVSPKPMEHHGELSCQSDFGLLVPTTGGNGFGPGLQRGTLSTPSEERVGCRVQQGAHQLIPGLGDPSGTIDFARLISAWCQSKVRSDVARAAKAARIIDRSDEGHRGDRPNARHAHEPTDDSVAAGDAPLAGR